jgi:hypothetical protein
MKALTLWQPWASLVALGMKQVETRCWTTKYRGELAIHAAAKLPPKWLGASRHDPTFRDELADVFDVRRDRDDRSGPHVDGAIQSLPYGSILCIVRLVGIEETQEVRETLCIRENIFGNYEDGRYAWFLELVERFEQPIPAKGNRMLWNWERKSNV